MGREVRARRTRDDGERSVTEYRGPGGRGELVDDGSGVVRATITRGDKAGAVLDSTSSTGAEGWLKDELAE